MGPLVATHGDFSNFRCLSMGRCENLTAEPTVHRDSRLKSSRRSAARERMRRRAERHRGAITDLQNRQTALVGPIGAEAKHAIGAIEAGPVGEDVWRITLRALGMGKRGGEGHGIVSKCRDTGWIGVIFGAVARREGIETAIFGRREPCSLQRRKLQDARVVTKTGAEDLHMFAVDSSRGQGMRPRLHRIGLFWNEKRIDLIMKRGDFLHSFDHGSWLVMFDRHHSYVVTRGGLLEFAFRHAS